MSDITTTIVSEEISGATITNAQPISVAVEDGVAISSVIGTNQAIVATIAQVEPITVLFTNPIAGVAGTSGTSGTSATGSSGYNFIDTTPATDATVSTETTSITIKTMRRTGTSSQVPSLTINGSAVTPVKTTGDENIYAYTFSATLAVGANAYVIVSENGVELTKTLTITRTGVAPSCSLAHTTYLKAGAYTVTMTTDYDLISTPTLDASIGSLSAFTGSGKTWTATLTIVAENGNGTFSNAVLVGSGGTGTTITSGSTYVVDTVIPIIGTANFSTTLWHYETGSMTCTVAMGEATTGFTGYINLSNFGLSTSYAMSPSGNNMVATFTPTRTDTAASYGTNIRVSDRCGNAAVAKANTDNQLQVIAYRVAPQNVTFPAYSATSNALSGAAAFETDANSHVAWGAGQTNTGTLTFTTDYTVTGHNKIHLDETKWADTIAANALGLLNVDVYEN